MPCCAVPLFISRLLAPRVREALAFFHYRDRDDFEVDIVIERGPGVVGEKSGTVQHGMADGRPASRLIAS